MDSKLKAKPLLLSGIVYVLTGFLQPVLTDLIRYEGGTGPRWPPMLLPVLASVVGMSLVSPATAFLRGRRADGGRADGGAGFGAVVAALGHSPRLRWRLLGAAAIDLTSAALLNAGLLSLGGAVYVVIYASNTLWTALISVFCGGHRLGARRWLSVMLLTLGIALNGLASSRHDRAARSDEAGATAVLGTALLLCGTIAHSLMFVISARLMDGGAGGGAGGAATAFCGAHSKPGAAIPAVSGHVLCSAMGMVETVVLFGWNAGLCVSRSRAGDSWRDGPPGGAAVAGAVGAGSIVALYAVLAIVNMLHALVFFSLLQSLGPVASAAMKGAQTLLVFLAGALYFCPVQHDSLQCATLHTTAAMTLVLVGLLGFAFSAPASVAKAPSALAFVGTRMADKVFRGYPE
eukprot:g1474.t1